MGEVDVGHVPAPLPEPLTGMVVVDVPSLTVTVPLVNALEGLVRRTLRTFPLTEAVTLPVLDAALKLPEPPERTDCAVPTQSVSVSVEGLAVIGWGVPHAAAPEPLEFTVMLAVDDPSATVTTPPENAEDGFTRRIVRTLPLRLALTLPLLDAALYVPAPPEIMTCAAPLQSVRVTLEGLAMTGLGGFGVGQVPDPAPAPVTSIVRPVAPSETVTVPVVNSPEGFVRRIETTLPLIVAVRLLVPETTE